MGQRGACRTEELRRGGLREFRRKRKRNKEIGLRSKKCWAMSVDTNISYKVWGGRNL